MRVLMVTNMYPTAADPSWGVFVKSQIDSIARQGLETDIYTIDGRASTWNYARALAEVRRRLAARHYDVVHAHFGLSGLACLARGATPLVVSFCGDDLLGTPRSAARPRQQTVKSRALVWAGRLLARRAAAVIVKSRGMLAALPAAVQPRSHVIANGVDLDVFRPRPRAEARSVLGLDADGCYVLFPSRPDELRKRLDVAREAMRALQSRGVAAELLVVHSQPQERLAWYMNACDALLLTSMWEGSPNVIKEAMACNLPIVSVDVGDVAEVIGGCAGCRLAEREPGALAEALAAILVPPRRTAGRERIAPLALDAVARRVIAVYQEVLPQGAKGMAPWMPGLPER